MIHEGIIILNKPAGYTSHDCVAVLRKLTGIKRIGHTGTLDPQATGVLTLCIGSAARINEYLDYDFKTYKCEIEFGKITDTYDVWGEEQSLDEDQRTALANLTEERIRNAFSGFEGRITQTPPKYSALKVNGRKLYEYARAGQEVEIRPREVIIESLVINHIDIENKKADFTVKCSKGTYIRSICYDVGMKLGCGAVMSGLVRLESGACRIEDSVTMEELRAIKDINSIIKPADFALMHMGKINIPEDRARWFVNGGKLRTDEGTLISAPKTEEQKDFYCVYADSDFLGVALLIDGQYKPDKIFWKKEG